MNYHQKGTGRDPRFQPRTPKAVWLTARPWGPCTVGSMSVAGSPGHRQAAAWKQTMQDRSSLLWQMCEEDSNLFLAAPELAVISGTPGSLRMSAVTLTFL